MLYPCCICAIYIIYIHSYVSNAYPSILDYKQYNNDFVEICYLNSYGYHLGLM